MSFIYDDKKLIQDLIKAGEDFENKFIRRGQAASPQLTQEQINNLASKLVTNLQTQYQVVVSDPSLGKSAQLFQDDISSLSKFLTHCEKSSLMFAGKNLVVKGDDFQYVTEPERPNYAQWKDGANLFYVYKEGLLTYINQLLAKFTEDGDQISKNMLKALIDEANSKLKLGASKEGPKAEDKAFTDTQPFDKIPAQVDFADINTGGNESVLGRYFKDGASFNEFLSKLKTKAGQAFNNRESVTALLKYLHDRAEKVIMLEATRRDTYFALLNRIATLFGLAKPGEGSSANSGQPNAQGVELTPAQEQKVNKANEAILQLIPLNESSIDLTKYQIFFESINKQPDDVLLPLFKKLYRNSSDEAASTAKNGLKQRVAEGMAYLRQAQQLIATNIIGQDVLSPNANPTATFMQILRVKDSGGAANAANALNALVRKAHEILQQVAGSGIAQNTESVVQHYNTVFVGLAQQFELAARQKFDMNRR